jgi:hypothetical protein
MALADDVILRIPNQVLIENTNPRDPSATEIDTTLLAQAATSVQFRFQMYAQETYSSLNEYHVELAVHGVLGLLRIWGSGDWGSTKDLWEWFRSECAAYRSIGPRARIVPSTNSPLTPSNEEWPSTTIRPWSDDPQFYDILPNRRSGTVEDFRNT